MKPKSIFERIRNELREEYKNSTQDEIASRGNVSQVTVGRYLGDAEKIKAMRLDTFFALFPEADILFRKPREAGERLTTMLQKMTEVEQGRALAILEAAFPHHAS